MDQFHSREESPFSLNDIFTALTLTVYPLLLGIRAPPVIHYHWFLQLKLTNIYYLNPKFIGNQSWPTHR